MRISPDQARREDVEVLPYGRCIQSLASAFVGQMREDVEALPYGRCIARLLPLIRHQIYFVGVFLRVESLLAMLYNCH